MKVVSRNHDSGAYLANEDFKEDALVDVKPYTPANMHTVYAINQYTVGNDNTGFVLDTAGYGSTNTTSLVYTHKPGTEYPVTCLVAPETNLEWRDYEFSGKIIKPVGAVYDTVSAGIVLYASTNSSYRMTCSHDSLFIDGGGFNKTYLQNISFNSGDILGFRAVVATLPVNDIPDKKTNLQLFLNKNLQGEVKFFEGDDISQQRLSTGFAGFYVDLSNVNNYSGRGLAPIKIKDVTVKCLQ